MDDGTDETQTRHTLIHEILNISLDVCHFWLEAKSWTHSTQLGLAPYINDDVNLALATLSDNCHMCTRTEPILQTERKKAPLVSLHIWTMELIFDVVETSQLWHVYENGADSSASNWNAKLWPYRKSTIVLDTWTRPSCTAEELLFCESGICLATRCTLPRSTPRMPPYWSVARTTRHDTSRTTRHARHGTATPYSR